MTRGSFWVTGDRVQSPAGSVLLAPMYVEWETPGAESDRPPIVLVHGGGGQGTDYLSTPDGRPGWAPLLVEAGHPVYVVDRPGHGRSPHDPAVLGPLAPTWGAEVLQMVFLGGPDGPPLPPNTRWPGALDGTDEVFSQFIASQGPLLADTERMHALERDRLVSLLERIGPAVVVAHSAGGPGAYLAADTRPDLVRALVAVETIGPPFLGQPQTGMTLPWGLAAAPMNYDPPISDVAELKVHTVEEGPVPKMLQVEPAHTLPGLAQVPIAVVTAQASPFRFFDGHLVDFLDQVGCTSTLLRLEEHGIEGNGHGMMLETNNVEVLAVITDWLAALAAEVDA
ncbi:alpha/beta fold hydrolase [Nocardioides sp.]|uniref:alpha/beta fold hydrolase n=1 Tax=Nocardioides sp. TaxID=35761 RepID=UPI002630D4E9|nr:alpha/beta fold hydrolase [Nocardioides sp.]